MLKVASGTYRRRNLKSPQDDTIIRPTASFVKSAMFNMLGNFTVGCRVLELFCGTGQLSIEALSRGASSAVLVDSSTVAVRLSTENLALLGLQTQAKVVLSDVQKFLSSCVDTFDLILLDPPYNLNCMSTIENMSALLSQNGLIVYETDAYTNYAKFSEKLELLKQKVYGKKCVSIYSAKQPL